MAVAIRGGGAVTVMAAGDEVLEQAFDGVSEAVVVTSLDGTISRVNRAAEVLYGVAREECLGRDVRSLVHPLLAEEEMRLLVQIVAAGQVWSGEMAARCGDLRTRLLHCTNMPLLEHGRVVGLIACSREQPLPGDASSGLSDALVLVDRDRRLAHWSAVLRTRLGVDLTGRPLDDFAALVHPDDLSSFHRLVCADTSDVDRGTVRIRNEHDGYVSFDCSVNDLRTVDEVAGHVLTLHRSRAHLPASTMASTVAAHALRAGFTVDLRGMVKRWSAGAERLYGWTAKEITGHPLSRFKASDAVDDCERHLRRALRNRGMVHFEVRQVTKFGQPIDVTLTLSTICDDDGQPLEILVLADDVTTAVDVDQDPERVAVTDGLTGLPNRSRVFERLGTALGQAAPGRNVAVLFVDVDSFKLVNDSLGHRAGDELLVAIGRRLASCVSASDIVGRVGGDEFVVVCSNLPGERAATAIAARILERVSEPVIVSSHEVLPAVSIGIAIADRATAEAEDVLSQADTAMYRAKANGRARYEVFDQALHQRALLRLELEEDLRRALRERELVVRYQPVVSLDDGRIRGVEALVRWNHPERGTLLPGEFLPMAEETGLIVPIGRQVISDACAQLARWRADGLHDLTLAINISPRQLADPELLAHLVQQVELHGLAPESIVLELTEHALLTEAVADPAGTFREFRDAGFRLSIDDFGTGYCSLLYLRHFPVSQLKLDRLFIAGLGRDPHDDAIIESVLNMAKAMRLEAVAEGIERPEQLVHLRRLGCRLGQGFLWAAAVDGDEITAMASGRAALVPAVRPVGTPEPSDDATLVVALPAGDRHRTTLVLIDDSTAERTLLRRRLEDTGRFDVIGEAANGIDGIELVARLQPDLVILDVAMPGMDGLDVLTELRAVAGRAAITILSGYISASVRRAALARGATTCVDKNAHPQRLVEELLLATLADAPTDLAAS